ncbi:Clp protease N-terminal domain-containing protein [Phycicoccus sp.]|uniref:Clp protease N-terminal domain-containing protein n=1 Tax=Phycicoccus sp. TaxID=1902410 RepID=UPI002BF35BA8|nr:Clp protease N-terminal domain-containing protein [Phycicoccus sp.]HMM95070.1 Clp protease N-terminal domain-containing protein [Phycicoccus sp.]
MFERFTQDARAVVVESQETCRSLGVDEVRPVHLLLALTDDDTPVSGVLAAHGIDDASVRRGLDTAGRLAADPVDEEDAAALRALGIDLDAIRDAVDRQFGEGALDDAATAAHRAPPRGRVTFGRGAKKVLELALREAIRLRSREIRAEHIALGVLRCDDEAVRLLLRSLAVDPAAVRADLENRGRRSA